MRFLLLFWAALKKFMHDQGLFLSSGITFPILLCLIPTLVLYLAMINRHLYSDAEVMSSIAAFFQSVDPTLDPKILRSILIIVQHRHIAGVVGGLAFVGTSTMVFSSLRICLNFVFGVRGGRGFMRAFGLDLLMILITGGMLLSSMLLTSAVGAIQRLHVRSLHVFVGVISPGLRSLLPFCCIFLACFLLYTILPDVRISRGSALKAAGVASLLWEAAKLLFGWYVLQIGNYSFVYGSLGSLVVLALWIYYSSVIFILGAEVACLLERERDECHATDNG